MKGTILVLVASGVAQTLIKPGIEVYPNPSGGKFRLEFNNFENSQNSKLEVYGIRGEKIYELSISDAIIEIDLSTRANGIYMLKINDGHNVIAEKKLLKWHQK